MATGAVLFSEMIPGKEWEDSFNEWYDTEHIPLRMGVAGFRCARRYREVGSSKYLAVYEMDHTDVLQSRAYKQIKEQQSERTKRMLSSVSGFTRYIGELIAEQVNERCDRDPYAAAVLYPVMFEVPAGREDEFNDWYDQDHVPTLLKHPDWLACRRYRITEGVPGSWTHLALHYLADKHALDSEVRNEARNSPWRQKLAREDWFKGHYLLFEHLKTFHATNR